MSNYEDPDPMLDEIRGIREQIWREHGEDLSRMIEHYMELQKQFKGRLISRDDSRRGTRLSKGLGGAASLRSR